MIGVLWKALYTLVYLYHLLYRYIKLIAFISSYSTDIGVTSNSVYTIHPEFNLFQFSCQLWCHFYTKIYRFQNMILFSFSILTLHFNVKSQPHWQCKQMPRISEILCVQHFYSFSHLCTSHFCLQSISQPETNAKAENKKKFSLHLLIDFLISASSLFTLQFVTSLKALDKQKLSVIDFLISRCLHCTQRCTVQWWIQKVSHIRTRTHICLIFCLLSHSRTLTFWPVNLIDFSNEVKLAVLSIILTFSKELIMSCY